MQVGDLVRAADCPSFIGIIIRVFDHKLWETNKMGKQVNWGKVDKEPFAEVLWRGQASTINVAQRKLEVVHEGR